VPVVKGALFGNEACDVRNVDAEIVNVSLDSRLKASCRESEAHDGEDLQSPKVLTSGIADLSGSPFPTRQLLFTERLLTGI
jgi:hypothetical protein